MDTSQWPQEFGLVNYIEGSSNTNPKPLPKPRKDQVFTCPRCNSTNTKFCYYNNYSLTQPRYFCKACKRYWTEGGTLRNIPVGGASRKNKKVSKFDASKAIDHVKNPQNLSLFSSQNPNKTLETQDLNLSFQSVQDSGAMMNSFFPMMPASDPNVLYSLGFSLHEMKPALGNGGFGNLHGISGNGNNGRILFPYNEMKTLPSTSHDVNHDKEQGNSTGYWNGMLGGNAW